MVKQYKAGKMVKIIVEDCKTWNLDTIPRVEALLRKMVDTIGMNFLAGPLSSDVNTWVFGDNLPINDGISSVIMIMESHIAIHCWQYYKSARIVIDSCKDFQVNDLISLLTKVLSPEKVDIAHEVWV